MRRLVLLVLLAGLLVTCGAPPPLPLPERKPAQCLYLPFYPQAVWDKHGVAVANGACALGVGAGWYYDWTPRPALCGEAAAIPMIYCRGTWQGLPETYTGVVFALNEPERSDQCNLSPVVGAVAWREIEQRFPWAKLVGPALSQDGADWYAAWLAAYRDLYGQAPRLWAGNVHCYGDSTYCRQWLTASLARAQRDTRSGQVWLTEWGVLPCRYGGDTWRTRAEADVLARWLRAEPAIAAYAWFATYVPEWEGPPTGFGPGCNTSLVDAAGRLTAFGAWYAGW